MKFLLFISIAVVFPLFTFSQATEIGKKIDSLRTEIQDNTVTTLRLNSDLAFFLIKAGQISEAKSLITENIQKELKQGISDTAAFFQTLDLFGEIFFVLQDINKALEIWHQNLVLKMNYLGQNSVFLAESYSNIAKAYNFKIAIDSAYIYGHKAYKIIQNADSVDYTQINVPEILKTHIYAYKIYHREESGVVNSTMNTIYLLDSAMEISHPLAVYYVPDFMHDKANCYTDLALYFQNHNRSTKHPELTENYCFAKSMHFYDMELENRDKINSNPAPYITLYFTKALSTSYTYGEDETNAICLSYCNEALKYEKTLKNDSLQDIVLKSNSLQIRYFRGVYLRNFYDKSKDTTYLYQVNKNALESLDIFFTLLNNLQSQKLGSLYETYGLFQFNLLYYSEIELFKQTNDTNYLEKALIHSQLSKNIDIAQQRLSIFKYKEMEKLFRNTLAKWIKYSKEKEAAIIDYNFSWQDLSIILIKDGKLFHHNEINPLHKPYTQFKNNIALRNDSSTQALNLLYSSLIKPLKNEIDGCQELIIIPYQHLALIPFDALIPDLQKPAEFLGDKYRIRILYSLFINSLKTDTLNGIMLGIFEPKYTKHSDLPFNKAMTDNLFDNFCTVNLNEKSIENVNNAYALHIIAHGIYDSTRKESAIFTNDTTLLYGESFLHLENPPVLTSIVSCKSTTGKEMSYEGIESIGRAFAIAGTRTIIAGNWELDDKASSIIMEYFYENLSDEIPVHDALRQAKIRYRKDYPEMSHPFYWASIQVTGDEMVLALEKRKNYFWLIWVGVLVVVGITGFVLVRRISRNQDIRPSGRIQL